MSSLPKYLKLHLEGGIGDCLKVVMCNFPLQSLYNNYGIQTFITYGGEHYNDCGWENILKKEFFDLCPAFIYVNRDAFLKIEAPNVSDFFRQPKPFSLKLSKNLLLDLGIKKKPLDLGQRHIGIQLDSNDSRKKFHIEKWKKLVSEILCKHHNTHIYLFGAPSDKKRFDDNFASNPKLHNTCGNSLAESLYFISQMNLFISPDSFSKYVCLCANVPAIILCAKLSYMSVPDMLNTCFKDIHNNDNYKLLGLSSNPVTNINDISIDDILSHIN